MQFPRVFRSGGLAMVAGVMATTAGPMGTALAAERGLILVETSVGDQHWSLRKQKAVMQE